MITDTTELTEIPARLLERPRVIQARRTGYVHRPIIVVYNELGVTEDGTPVQHLPAFVASMPSHIWVTLDASWLLDHLCVYMDTFGVRDWNYQLTEARTGHMSHARLLRFGLKPEGKQRRAMHLCWTPYDMLDAPERVIPPTLDGLMRFATDVRAWLKEQNLPVPTTLSAIGSALLRDKRFYPDPRGRVPSATNERVREWLPGVHQELHTKQRAHRSVITLDQRGAYHQIVQDIALPDSTTLHARGYFNDPENAPLWLQRSHPDCVGVLAAPGLVCIDAHSRRSKPSEFRPPALDYIGTRRLYLWTNEVEFAEQHGVTVIGLVAAWVAEDNDTGLARYGRFAQHQISAVTDYRKRWLKPSLHSAYGLLGAKPRTLRNGFLHGRGEVTKWLLGVRAFNVHESELDHKPPLGNAVQLGMIQAEVRLRTLRMANYLSSMGVTVTHVHADGLHAIGDMSLLVTIDDRLWRMEERTNLTYLDRVSWTTAQGDTLPGRAMRDRVDQRRHLTHVQQHAKQPSRHR